MEELAEVVKVVSLDDLALIWTKMMECLGMVWVVWTSGGILSFGLVLWILDRVFHIFDVLKR